VKTTMKKGWDEEKWAENSSGKNDEIEMKRDIS